MSVAGATYLAVSAHTAGAAFAHDLEAGLWLLIANPFSISGAAFSQVFNGDGVTTFTLAQEFTNISEARRLCSGRLERLSPDAQLRRRSASLLGVAARVLGCPGLRTANIVAEAVNQTAAAGAGCCRVWIWFA